MNRLYGNNPRPAKGFLSREGSLSLQFNPSWPLQQYVGGAASGISSSDCSRSLWSFTSIAAKRRSPQKSPLGVLRGSLLLLLLILLNRPVLTLGQARREHSVLAILLDDSVSMKVKDAVNSDGKPPVAPRRDIDLLTANDGDLLRKLAAMHDVHIYDFSRGASRWPRSKAPETMSPSPPPAPANEAVAPALAALADLKPMAMAPRSSPR